MRIPNIPSAAMCIPGLKRTQDTRMLRVYEPKQLVATTCRYLHVNEDDLRKKTRKKEVVYARHISMYLLKNFTTMTYKSIGILMGNRDHTTCIYACNLVFDQLSLGYDNPYKEDVARIIDRIKGKTIRDI